MKTTFLIISIFLAVIVGINTILFIIEFVKSLKKEAKKSKEVKETIILYKDGTWELYDQEEQK